MATRAGKEVVVEDVARLIDEARISAARSVNALMTAAYWCIGRRIVEEEQGGKGRAGYGDALLARLSEALTNRFGRGFSERNLRTMRAFFVAWPLAPIRRMASAKSTGSIRQMASAESGLRQIAALLPLPWSHYSRLLRVEDHAARQFYETESLRGGWTVKQLERQIDTQFYERTMMSRKKTAMLEKGSVAEPADEMSVADHIKDPFVLEFLDLKDEYSETDLEEALIGQLESFLLELGGDFAFIGRQRRLRVGDHWYRVDLVFFHRKLRCLVVIDLKLGELTHADAGQMHLYLNYAREHWTNPGENPPVGLILCARRDEAIAKYALEGLPNKVLAAEYRRRLPDEALLAEKLDQAQRSLLLRRGQSR